MNYSHAILDTSRLNLTGDFDEQLDQLMRIVRLARAEVEILQKLYKDVERTLSILWPGSSVHPFGSIVTGLGIKTSDVDCYIQIPDCWCNPQEIYVGKAKNLFKRKPVFSQLFAITNARVPILKFYHVPTKRNCDLNFKSLAGVKNSELLGHLMQIDKRGLLLAVVVKYWSKVHALTGTNLLPNYALSLMVVFYLQQINILPSILRLQRDADLLMIDNWNTGFIHGDFMSNNNENMYDIIGGFFQYYDTFKFEDFVICPFLGVTLKKLNFYQLITVPEEFQCYKKNVWENICLPLNVQSQICIQDPFEHSRNCSVAVQPKLVSKIKSFINICAKEYLSGTVDTFLKNILTTLPVPVLPVSGRPHLPVPKMNVSKRKPINKKTKTKLRNNLISMYTEYQNKFKRN